MIDLDTTLQAAAKHAAETHTAFRTRLEPAFYMAHIHDTLAHYLRTKIRLVSDEQQT